MLVPDYIKSDILTTIINREVVVKYGLDFTNRERNQVARAVQNRYNEMSRRLESGENLTANQQAMQREIDGILIDKFGNPDIDPNYKQRLSFADGAEFDNFLNAKKGYKDLFDNGIYSWRLNRDGSITIYQSLTSWGYYEDTRPIKS